MPKKATVLFSVTVMVTEVTNLLVMYMAASVEIGTKPDMRNPTSQKL